VTGCPSYTPGTGFPLRLFLRLSGLRSRYSNPPPDGNKYCIFTQYAQLSVNLH
jgi:hypothetical protein